MSSVALRDEGSCFERQVWPVLVLKRSDPLQSAGEFCKHRLRSLLYWRGDFYEWAETSYRPLTNDAVKTEIYSFLSMASVNIEVKTRDGVKWITTSFGPTTASVQEVLNALKHLAGRTFIPDDIDAPDWLRSGNAKPDPTNLIALKNVIVDLETGATFDHSPDFFTMTALPFPYDPEATCPRWEQFVSELFPDKPTRREFQKAVGYMLSSDRSQQKVFLVIGPRRSGKGTMINVMTGLLGRENTVSPDLNELKENFGKEQLINKKAAFFADERLRGDTTPVVRWLLKLSGEDDVSIPRKHRQNWQGRPAVRLWIATNETPAFDDASGVIASRFIMFRLTRSFFGQEDVGLADRLLGERPGILNWAMEGLRMLREDKCFKQPAHTEADVERMRDIASPVLAFAKEMLAVQAGRSVGRDELYRRYVEWCEDAGHKPQSRTKFVGTLMDEYPSLKEGKDGPRGKQVVVLRGIGWAEGRGMSNVEVDEVMESSFQVVQGGRA